jgi:hypothetical protein
MALLHRELRDLLAGHVPEGPAAQPVERARRQSDRASSGVSDTEVAHLVERMAAAPARLLTTSLATSPDRMFRFTSGRLRSRSLLDSARRAARRMQATEPMVTFAAYVAALSALAVHDEVYVTNVVSGRVRPEDQTLVGMASTGVPTCIRVDHALTFAEVVHRVRNELMRAQWLADAPYGRAHDGQLRGLRARGLDVDSVWFNWASGPGDPMDGWDSGDRDELSVWSGGTVAAAARLQCYGFDDRLQLDVNAAASTLTEDDMVVFLRTIEAFIGGGGAGWDAPVERDGQALRAIGTARRPPDRWAHLDDGWVDLGATDDLLRDVPGVLDACSGVSPSAPAGAQIAALVVADDSVLGGDLRRHLLNQLGAHPAARVPARVAAVPGLPVEAVRHRNVESGPLGTVWRSLEESSGGAGVSAASQAEQALIDAIVEVRGVVPRGVDESYFDLAGPACERIPAVIQSLRRRGFLLTTAPLLDPFIDLAAVARSLVPVDAG